MDPRLPTAEPSVQAVAWTHFEAPPATPWSTDTDGGEALAEFAGRACYQSWSKPNPATATNAGYLRHILEVGHLSVLEHGTVTFYLTGVSRSFTHELIRHRHFSYSQLSQRYAGGTRQAVVVPTLIADDPHASEIFNEAAERAVHAYADLLDRLDEVVVDAGYPHVGEHRPTVYLPEGSEQNETCRGCDEAWPCRTVRTSARKESRQAARALLPNAVETRIVVTGNYRAWRHFINTRATVAADVEIRQVAILILRELQRVAPNVFADFEITPLDDGTQIAATPYAWES